MTVVSHSIAMRCLALTLLFTAGAVSSQAQRTLPTTTAQAAQTAGAIVVAKVIDIRVRDAGWYWTDVEFQALEVVKGTMPSRFRTSMLGGRINDKETRSGEPLPNFVPGQEVVLFVTPQQTDDGSFILLRDHVYHVMASGSAKTVHPAPTGLALAVGDSRGSDTAVTRLDEFVNALKGK
ncbi:MAG TPA: hypothetical protein VMO26_02035 [Vicinamibacterales bacterium]|nr:hypothetical protein [Vicinamibacterales bacterium]